MAQHRAISRILELRIPATLVGAAIFLLSACQDMEPVPEPAPTQVKQPPIPVASVTPQSNFAFVFEWSSCGAYRLNTFDNSLTLTTNMSPPTTTTLNFVISQQALSDIYQKMVEIDLFSYPDEFSIQLPPQVIRVYGISALYNFDVRSGNQRKVVRWNDEFSEPADMPWTDEDSQPSKTQAAKLRELIILIQQIVEAQPEFDKLPEPGGCA